MTKAHSKHAIATYMPWRRWLSRLLCVLGMIVGLLPGIGTAAPLSVPGHDRPFAPGQAGMCVQSGPVAGGISEAAKEKLLTPKELGVGEWHIIGEVCPREKFFPTSVLVTPGATYEISAVGRWKDQWIRTGPEGWLFPPFQPFNRIPWRRMFVLSGSLGSSLENAFVIGRQTTWRAPMMPPRGTLAETQVFPNDWESKYDNNRSLSPVQGGPMRVTIRRVA